MISPHVRRWRLGQEIRNRRIALGLGQDELAAKIRKSRPRLSDLETGKRRPDLAEVMKVLLVLGVTQNSSEWNKLVGIARDASEAGWWDSFGLAMGERQQLRANLEAGADIAEYSMIIPGLLQTEEFVRARAARRNGELPYDLERAVAARAMRQGRVRQAGGPSYSVVLDIVGVTRLAAPPAVMASQLEAIVDLPNQEGGDRITVRVLAADAKIEDYWLPRSQFACFRYPDPGDGVVVCVDAETEDRVLMGDAGTPHVQLLDRLTAAALSVEDSAALIAETAERFSKGDD